MSTLDSLVRYLNDSRYTIRSRDSIHYTEPEVSFDPVPLDEFFEDFTSFCKTERVKPMNKEAVIEALSNLRFSEVTLDSDNMLIRGVKVLRDGDERGLVDGCTPNLARTVRRFLDKHTVVTGMGHDHVVRAKLYDLFTEHTGVEVSRQVFYRVMMNLSFESVRYPIHAGFAKGGVHCFRGVLLKHDEL